MCIRDRVVTVEGIFIEVKRPLEKAKLAIVVTLLGIVESVVSPDA